MVHPDRQPLISKGDHELEYWSRKYRREQRLSNAHYEHFYTTFFGVSKSLYSGKCLLDIGCGPRGSLEWADNALLRVGLDPLAHLYRQFGTHRHTMGYVASGAERMPFDDGRFDAVFTFNSLDHVDDLNAVITEIKRVTRPGGHLFVVAETNHTPTPTEPLSFSWNVTDRFEPEFTLLSTKRFAYLRGTYQSLHLGLPYASGPGKLVRLVRRALGKDPQKGVLTARFRRERSGTA